MRTTRLKAYAAGLAAMVALIGCGSGEGGTAAPPRSGVVTGAPTATASTTAAATATTTAAEDPVLARIPAAARPETREGAEAFARYFMDSLNEATEQPNSELLDDLFADTCKTCIAMRNTVVDLEDTNRRYGGPTVRVRTIDPIAFDATQRIIRVEIDQLAVHVVDASGKSVDRTVADEGAFAMTLDFVGGQWQVTKLQTIAS